MVKILDLYYELLAIHLGKKTWIDEIAYPFLSNLAPLLPRTLSIG